MNAYTRPAPAKFPMLRAPDIEKLFGRERGWFDRNRTRKRLYAKGFPHPLERGLWSAAAVAAWIETAGRNPGNVPPDARPTPSRRGPKRRRASGYAAL